VDEEAFSADDDYKLVVKAQAGDAGAYDELMLRYQQIIGRQMARFSNDPAVREELTQNVFVNAYFALGNYRPLAPFSNWLKVVANRTGYDYWRESYKRNRFMSLSRIDESELGAREDPDPGGDRWEELTENMNLLKPEERQVLYMQYLDGMSIETIAAAMGWSRVQTKMRSFRARRKLRAILKSRNK
jgi:RNA polymerase sigma-70 factor (ECF subfamily)